eukprot:CAMPEP_0198497964 /NCGR_PEP_ID=MMETSP1462-20131121/6713_1 /TAXON_ID=1333877 /ORGANISM="Brandtodinium nutriculum, Strain RCC3387" /LENGTH=405 /DNA_ID=CAMNT_0044226855 /DNA_START=60 /DNA_END=1274 /DNA_ORIENTATION=+
MADLMRQEFAQQTAALQKTIRSESKSLNKPEICEEALYVLPSEGESFFGSPIQQMKPASESTHGGAAPPAVPLWEQTSEAPQSENQVAAMISYAGVSQAPTSGVRTLSSQYGAEQSEFSKGLQKFRGKSKASSDGGLTLMRLESTTEADMASGRAWNPDSATRMTYESVSMVMVFLDGFMIPYTLAWGLGEEGAFAFFSWITRVFWMVDLLLSFITGYHTKQHVVELRLSYTVRKFLTTWFAIDLSLVIWDWVGTILPGLRLIRLGRLVRMFRQSRRALDLAYKAKAMFCAKVVHLSIDISVLMLLFFWMAHVVCCGWYALGTDLTTSDSGETWLVDANGVSSYSKAGSQFEYTTSLHWSLTQLTPASMDVVPKCTKERIYNIAVILGGFVVGSTLVATLSAMMT